MEPYSEISYVVRGAIATISLNRPHARNGYTLTMADELAHAFDRADHDETIRVVVLTGEGKDFCVGADLSGGGFEVNERDADEHEEWKEPAGRCSMRIFTMTKPVIAAIPGAAVGAGATITLSCDYRLATLESRFGFVFSRRGIYPEGASTWFLPRLVGLGRALDWMISGRMIEAAEAQTTGLVHSLHPKEDLLTAAYERADELAATTAPVSVAVIRQMLYRMSPVTSPFEVQKLDSRLIAQLPNSADAAEGVASFLERRPPAFPGTVPANLPDYLPWLDGTTTS